MTDTKRTILARRARFLTAALAGVACGPPVSPVNPAATNGAQSIVIPPLDAGQVSPIATTEARDVGDPGAARPTDVRDRDGDGVADDDDACPDQPGTPSVVAGNNGCPGPSKVVVSVCLSIMLPPKVTFVHGGATPNATTSLDVIANALLANAQLNVEIEGHTEPSEAPALGQQRADAVLRELVKRGVAQTRLTTSNAQATKPLASNATPEGRAKNRRVEINVR